MPPMSTDFFQQQDVARRKTGWLVFFFILAVVSIILAVYLVVLTAFGALGDVSDSQTALSDTPELWNPELFTFVCLGTIAVIVLGSLYKTSQLSSGGEAVALMLGGRLIDQQTRDLAERRLLNVVEEMALASGTPVPPVFVMDNESSINAFAAGFQPGDAVIGVSRGSLQYLTRDELQGVMAHEFSHMLNGDMRLNIRLIGILHGILILAIIGYYVMRMAGSSSRGSDKKGGAAAMVLVGLGLVAIGFIGLFFGKLIKSGVSRQREYLADASAVQFTRYPSGIAGALKKIGGLAESSRIKDAHADEVSHMFFGDAFAGMAFNMFSTHPPLAKRIGRLDPQFDGEFPTVRPLSRKDFSPEAERKERRPRKSFEAFGAGRGAAAGGAIPMPVDPTGVIGRIGVPGMEQIIYAAALLEAMPQPVIDAAHEPYGARAIVYALLLDRDEKIRNDQLESLKPRAEELSYRQTLRVAPLVDKLPEEAHAPLLDLAFPALKKLSPAQYSTFRDNVEALVAADGKIDLFEYMIRSTLLRNLDVQFGRGKPATTRYHSIAPIRGQIATVLSTVARAGHETQRQAEHAFGLAAAELGKDVSLSPIGEFTFARFDEALKELAFAAPKVKKRILAACTACIGADQKVTAKERELLRVIAGMLDCPLPPMVPPKTP